MCGCVLTDAIELREIIAHIVCRSLTFLSQFYPHPVFFFFRFFFTHLIFAHQLFLNEFIVRLLSSFDIVDELTTDQVLLIRLLCDCRRGGVNSVKNTFKN